MPSVSIASGTVKTVKAVKVPNYTEDQVARMREVYTASETPESVKLLMEEFGKPKRSIVAKLSNMGIYKTPVRTTKTGAPIIKKEDLVKEISRQMDGLEIDSLVKSNKQDLVRVADYLRDHFGELRQLRLEENRRQEVRGLDNV